MKTVAVIGASQDEAKFGNKAVRAFKDAGWNVIPVSPKGGKIDGIEVVADLTTIEESPDVISVYLPPPVFLKQLPFIAELGCRELWINPGAGSAEVISEARSLGLEPVETCSILHIGKSPMDY